MLKSWRLGSILGFPVDLNVSFLLLLGLVLVAYGGLAGVALVCLAFASVLVHELGHAVIARQRGVRIASIELSFFGGAAKMVELPRSANDELAIAAAGPIVSLAIAGAGLGLGSLLHSTLFAWIGVTNLVIAGFNLIPALPMDGGRILRALLTRWFDFVRATDIAVDVSRVAAIAFVVIGLAGWYQLLFLAPFLWLLGSRERMIARMMADNYAYSRGGYVRTTDHADRFADRFDRWAPRQAQQPPRGYTIRQVGGRFVIEPLL